MFEAPAGVPVVGFGCGPDPPLPQLTTSRTNAIAPQTTEQRLAFLPQLPNPTTKNPNTIPSVQEVKVQGRRPASGTVVELGAVVLIVRVLET
jgi:hypothetical protein